MRSRISSIRRLFNLFLKEYPLVPFALLFSFGQGIGLFLKVESTGVIAPILLLLALGSISVNRLRRFFTTLLVIVGVVSAGILSLLLFSPVALPIDHKSEMIFVAKVSGTPRFKKPGAAEAALLLTEYRDESTHRWVRFPFEPKLLCKGKDLPWRNFGGALRAPFFIARAIVNPIDRTQTPFSYLGSLKRQGFSGTCVMRYVADTESEGKSSSFTEDIRDKIRQSVEEATEGSEVGGCILSMVWGIADTLSHSTDLSFQRSGITHILVVSGAQVVMVFYAVHALLFPLFRGWIVRSPVPARATVAGIGISLSALFVAISGSDTPGIRALIAIVVWAFSDILNRGERSSARLVATYLVLEVLYPASWMDPGVQLTFAALVGLTLGSGVTKLGKYLSVCWYAWLGTSSVSAIWFQQLSLVGILVNPLLVPIVSFVGTYGGIGGTLLVIAIGQRGSFLLQGVAWFLTLFLECIQWTGSFQNSMWTLTGWESWGVATIFGALFFRKVLARIRATLEGLPRGVEL